MARHFTLGPGGEFDFIRALVERWGPAATGIGDDASVLDVPAGERLVVSTDSSVEDVHFRREWLTPWEIGWRATAAALSDLAAMAASPLGVVVAMSVPRGWRDEMHGLGDGIAACASRWAAPIVGGDTTGGEKLSLTLTVLGASASPLHRDGARDGDRVYVTGRLGASGQALDALLGGSVPAAPHRVRFATPEPRIREARWLAARGARAAIDISDGLLADLRHLASASGVAMEIDLGRVPVVEGVTARRALGSGEEYEVVVATPVEIDAAEFTAAFGIPLTEIGRARGAADGAEGTAGRVSVREGGEFVDLAAGYDHFST